MTTITKTAATTTRHPRFSPLHWLMRLDAAYRQHHALKQATSEQLDDMGISRDDADTAFFRQFASKKFY